MNIKTRPVFSSQEYLGLPRYIINGYVVKGEIWLEKDGKLYMNTKRATLLNLIDKFGSLAAAARTMQVTYNTAWLWVMAMNRLSGHPLVERRCGGICGGNSVLTAQGHKVITKYNELVNRLGKTINTEVVNIA